MTTYSIIQKSQLEGANRLDAEYYQPEYLRLIKQLRLVPHVRLGEIAYITDGEHGSPMWDENSGIKYFSAQHVKEGRIDDSEVKTISPIINERNKRSQLQENDVLLSTVGTIGLAGLVKRSNVPANIDRHVARIVLKPNTITPEFLTIFLNCTYGKFQTLRESTGNVQLNLFIEKIKTLLIPHVNSTVITQSVRMAFDQLHESQRLYSEAEQLLLQTLRLTDFTVKDDVGYVVNFSNIKNAKRMDPEFFQPKYEEITKKLMVNNAKQLGDIVSTKKGFEPGSDAYREQGKVFIRVSSLSKLGIEDKDQKYLSEDFYKTLKKEYEPKVGEILLTKDASPGIAYVLKEPVEGIISGGILRLQLKDTIDPEYVALCINSLAGQMQAERDAGGSIISHWKAEQVKQILIPILPHSAQQKISDLVIQSHEARKKSKELLEQAKREVEEMIERGEKN